MTEMTRRLLPAGTTAAPFAGWARVVDAAVPKDTAVFAKQADTGAAARNLPADVRVPEGCRWAGSR